MELELSSIKKKASLRWRRTVAFMKENPGKRKMKERYYFFLSPYVDCAFTRCPKCNGLTKQKKIPLFMHLERKKQFISMNKFCRFCPCCELLIAKKQEIVDFLKQYLQSDHIDDKDYFVFGTQDRADWLNCMNGVQEKSRMDTVFAFRDVLTFEPAGGWRKAPARKD